MEHLVLKGTSSNPSPRGTENYVEEVGETARARDDVIPWKQCLQMQQDQCMYELTETMAAHAKPAQVPVRQGPNAEQGN